LKREILKKTLEKMKKPETPHLKHEDILADAIISAKDQSVVSLWWLSIPFFIIIMLLLKIVYMPGTTLIANFQELASRGKYMTLIFFLISPVLIIIVNGLTIRKIQYLSGSSKAVKFLETVWLNILIITISVLTILIYLL
jgi:hypothetical protein